MSEEILFTNPEEQDLESLLETHKAPSVEIDHQEVVAQLVKKTQRLPAGNKDQGVPAETGPRDRSKDRSWAIPGQLPRDAEKVYCVDGQMLPASEAKAILSQEIDPESFNFLIQKQKQPLEPAELSIVGKDRRYPDVEECDSVIGHKCKFCGEEISQSEASWREIGGLVFYGQDSEGLPQVFHWSCLSLWCLLLEKGHPRKAAEKFNLDPDEITSMKMFYRSIPWGRLGFAREGQ